jgi:hypothetical protein
MRTDRDGTICVATDGERWGVSRIEDTIRGPTLACEPRGRPRRLLSTPTHPIDLNTASLDDLDRLPGIGPVLARRIFEGKPYATVDDLRRVKDIGAKRLEQIRPYVMAK